MRLQSITIYPIKGLGGVNLETCFVERRGLALDRRWMLVDRDGLFLSQRKVPKMATIRIHIQDKHLIATHSSFGSLKVSPDANGPTRKVRIWNSEVEAVEAGAETSGWFESVLETPCSLVQMPPSTVRSTNPQFSEPGDHVSFADGYPITLATESSLADLNGRLKVPVPMNRFRPNLVISGVTAPWEEDRWKAVKLGAITFRVAKPCGRCLVTTIDQETGKAESAEPLATLATFRNISSSLDFAINMIPENEDTIRLGLEMTVLDFE